MCQIDVNFNWIDWECAVIECPYCKKSVSIDIYRSSIKPCKCGKKFLLHQSNWVEEIIDEPEQKI